MLKALRLLQKTPPRCIRGFTVQRATPPMPRVRPDSVAYQLLCSCGSKVGRVLGHSLAQYNEKYQGPLTFISPLAFGCGKCNLRTEIIDTDIHGWHGEVDYSAVYRGKGRRQPFPCPRCGEQEFSVVVTFVHNGESLSYSEDQLPMARQDGFNGFQLHGTCQGCKQVTFIAGFDL
jgi:hypothetical protein